VIVTQPAVRESVKLRLEAVRQAIAAACAAAERDPAEVRLIAVSKTFPPESIAEAYAAGQRDFGENRVQEGLAKLARVAEIGLADAHIHLIGHLQRNKARHAGAFSSVQSVNSVRLAQAISRRLEQPLPVLLEVNLAGETSKQGFAPAELGPALAEISDLPHLDVQGLMTVPPLVADPEHVRPLFRELRLWSERLALPQLSMGMSNDYAVAIEEGATMVRIGRAIFGERA
jgi:pyridoxal phosphate enzyme (YggS family)